MAPRKVRLMGSMLKGLSANEAEAQLMYERKRAAKPLLKLLRSAMANAQATKKLASEKLFIESVTVDGGPIMKGRYLPRARGMASPIQRKMSHVTITLAEKEDLKSKFKIIVTKKAKNVPEAEKPKARKPKEKPEASETATKKKEPGVVKKMFRRKAV